MNIGKCDRARVWVARRYPGDDERAGFIKANSLARPLPHTADDFLTFFDARRALLVERMKDKLKTHATSAQTPATEPQTATESIEDALAEAESAD